MYGDPRECRTHAQQCLEKARTASNLLIAARFQGLAHLWLRLAKDLESVEALLERLRVPERRAS
jgi:hypothetical protein